MPKSQKIVKTVKKSKRYSIAKRKSEDNIVNSQKIVEIVQKIVKR